MELSRGHGGVRPRFCFLLAGVHTGASVDLWHGVAEEAEARDIDLLVLPAGRLGARDEYEYMRNGLARLIRSGSTDGLLSWVSSLSGECGPEDLLSLHEGFGPVPLVTLAQRVGGAPVVSLDAYGGMRALLDHLRDVHGYERIAFLRGPELHASAADRFRAYRDFLAGRGLPWEDRLVSSPLPWDEGGRALSELLDVRGLVPGQDFQAAAAASDLLAFWFLRGLQDRGFQVPADVAVAGFNDSPESRLLAPPLTTVAMPFREQGRRGLAALAELWQGAREIEDAVLPVSLVVRESCGCPSREVRLAGGDPGPAQGMPGPQRRLGTGEAPGPAGPGDAGPGGGTDSLDRTVEAVAEAVAEAAGADARAREAWVLPLVRAFRAEGGSGEGRFLPTLGRILDRMVHEEGPGLSWQNAVSALERLAGEDGAGRVRKETRALIAQARVMIGQAAARHSDFRRWTAEEADKRLRALGRALLTTYTVPGIASALAERLPALGMLHAYLVLDRPGDTPLLVLALRDGLREDLPGDGLAVESPAELPADLLPPGRFTLVLEPLFVNEEPLGCLVLDGRTGRGTVFEELRGFVSAALQGARLFAQAAEARARAERADRLKTRLLANVSHELRTPLGLIQDEVRALDPAAGRAEDGRLARGLARISAHARYQARVVNDLLDLSRADIEELDLAREYTDPGALARDCIESFRGGEGGAGSGVAWTADIREPLPLARIDPVRIRQILFNLLENARRHTARGEIRLTVRADPPWLLLEVSDTGSGIPPERLPEIFEPFSGDGEAGGIGLGLAISRRLAALHGGRIDASSVPGIGSRFTLRLPLPVLGARTPSAEPAGTWAAWVGTGTPDPAVAASLRAAGWEVRRADALTDELPGPGDPGPGALVLDPRAMDPACWALLRRLRRNPRLLELPVLVYESSGGAGSSGHGPGEAEPPGSRPESGSGRKAGAPPPPREILARLLDGDSEDLLNLLGSPILAVDDDPAQRSRLRDFFLREFPGFEVIEAARGDDTLTLLAERVPALVVLDLGLPGPSGQEILEYMKSEERLRHVPVIVLTGRLLEPEELLSLDRHLRVVVQVKGIWTDEEFGRTVRLALRDELGAGNPAVKRALAWILAQYGRPFTRSRLAEAAGVNEDHLSRLFHRELGIGIWDFLNRFRMRKAKELLAATSLTVSEVADRVGFTDPSYFCRVFRKLCGTTPQAYRESDGGR